MVIALKILNLNCRNKSGNAKTCFLCKFLGDKKLPLLLYSIMPVITDFSQGNHVVLAISLNRNSLNKISDNSASAGRQIDL